jgi:small subunit ribosomal protein S3
MASKGLGIRTSVGGRLNGVEMARTEGYREGVINTYTIRSDVDFAIEKA